MPISRAQLVQALTNWCIEFCYGDALTKNEKSDLLTQFCRDNWVPQEGEIPQRGSKAVLNTLKLIRALSRTV